MIEAGQKMGVFREGDAKLLSTCFWATVQGIMEEMAVNMKIIYIQEHILTEQVNP